MSRVGTFWETASLGETVSCYIPAPLPPSHPPIDMGRLWKPYEKAIQALGRLDGISPILPSMDLFLYSYVRKEALVSSHIEGTQSTLSDLLMVEMNETPRVSFDDVEEVSSYIRALNYGLKRIREDDFALSLRLVREIHRELLSTGRGKHKQPGTFRTSQNWIDGSRPGNAAFVPPPPHKLLDCLGNWEAFFHEEQSNLPILIKAGISHAQFETIHPFLDGNGRMGRLLITLWLCEAGLLQQPLLYLSLYFKTHRNEYYNWLTRVRQTGDWEGWLTFFLQGVYETGNHAHQSARQLLDLIQRDKAKLSRLGKAAVQAGRVLDVLTEHPLVTIGYLVEKLDIAPNTAIKALDNLIAEGVVREITGRQRNRVFSYDGVLSILSEGADPLPS